jgi:hypothetical protein
MRGMSAGRTVCACVVVAWLAMPPHGVAAGPQQNQLRFEDYPAPHAFTGTPAPPRLDTATYGKTFRTRLRDGAKQGPNFAGAFTVVVWGCGAPCQVVVVIDARTGQLSTQILRTSTGAEFRADSRMIIADPKRPDNPEHCVSCGTMAAYEWTGSAFRPLGSGPHEHIGTW